MKYGLPSWYERLMKKYPMVSSEEWLLLDSIATVKVVQKGESFLRQGKVARYAAFIISGAFKFCITDDDGNEKILKFGFLDEFPVNCKSYDKTEPSDVSIVALEESTILILNIKKLQPLYDLHINILHVNLELYKELMEQQSEHQHILSLRSPLQRYKYLIEKRPAIIQKISLTNIARYLYISREALSRARLLLTSSRRFCD